MNGINQRDSVEKSGAAFGGASYSLWKYDDLGEVTVADDSLGSGANFGYLYDAIGNRKRSFMNTTDVNTTVSANRANYRVGVLATDPLGGSDLNLYRRLEMSCQMALNDTCDDGNQVEGRFPTTPFSSPQAGNKRAWDGENPTPQPDYGPFFGPIPAPVPRFR